MRYGGQGCAQARNSQTLGIKNLPQRAQRKADRQGRPALADRNVRPTKSSRRGGGAGSFGFPGESVEYLLGEIFEQGAVENPRRAS